MNSHQSLTPTVPRGARACIFPTFPWFTNWISELRAYIPTILSEAMSAMVLLFQWYVAQRIYEQRIPDRKLDWERGTRGAGLDQLLVRLTQSLAVQLPAPEGEPGVHSRRRHADRFRCARRLLVRSNLGLSAWVQHERWLFPVIQPNVSRNVTATVEIMFASQKLFKRSAGIMTQAASKPGGQP